VLQTAASDGWNVIVAHSRRKPRHGFVFIAFFT